MQSTCTSGYIWQCMPTCNLIQYTDSKLKQKLEHHDGWFKKPVLCIVLAILFWYLYKNYNELTANYLKTDN